MTNHELFQLPNITSVQKFRDEFAEIVQKKPNSKKIRKKMLFLFEMLASGKSISALCQSKSFEKLTGTATSLYAMKIKVDCNLRVIFSYEKDGSILLLLFEEKAGKKNTDYSKAIPIAIDRLEEAKGGKKW